MPVWLAQTLIYTLSVDVVQQALKEGENQASAEVEKGFCGTCSESLSRNHNTDWPRTRLLSSICDV